MTAGFEGGKRDKRRLLKKKRQKRGKKRITERNWRRRLGRSK